MTFPLKILALLAVLAAAVAGTVLRSSSSENGAARPAGADARSAPREAPLRAAGLVVEPARIRDSVRTVGTVAADEAVTIVAELSRRLVKVHVADGSRVEKGQLLFELDDADLRAALAELEANRNLAARTAQRHRDLMEQDRKAVSQQAHDQALAELERIEAQVKGLAVTLAKTKIRAPFGGTVGLRRVSEGAWVTPETPLTTLQDTNRVKIDFALPERYASAVRPGQAFEFRVAGRDEAFTGEILALEPVIERDTRSLLVRGTSDNPDGALFPGAFASVEVPLEEVATGVMVPAQALVPSVDGHGVFVLRASRAELRHVEVGVRTPDSVQILRGLAPGETVLTTNLLRLRPGAAVELEDETGR